MIFLTAVSVTKPWVNHELRQAFTKELEGVDPAFIVPIKLGAVPSFPSFLKPKKDVDLDGKTENEAVEELYAAVMGQASPASTDQTPNLVPWVEPVNDSAQHVVVVFQPKYFPEDINFVIRTRETIVSARAGWKGRTGQAQLAIQEVRWPSAFAVRVTNERIPAGAVFFVMLEFSGPVEPSVVEALDFWDGNSGGGAVVEEIRFMSFTG